MPGFIFDLQPDSRTIFNDGKGSDYIVNSLKKDTFLAERCTTNKFQNDKIFHCDDNYFIVTEGVILNSKQLIQETHSHNLVSTIIKLYEQKGDLFFNDFRGSFSGIVFEISKNEGIVFTNHFGDQHIFYQNNNGKIRFASEIQYLLKQSLQCKEPIFINEQPAYMLLSYGFLPEDMTLFTSIKRLKPGNLIRFSSSSSEIKQFHKIDNTNIVQIDENEAIEETDRLFRNAIKLQFEKDIEYGYRHIVSLSGGLDSRMTTWVAHALGYDKMKNITFSQSGYLDATIAKKIAKDLQHEWDFEKLDSGECLCSVDAIVAQSWGSKIYYGQALGKPQIDSLNWSNIGILHTGQLGDVILGSYNSSERHIAPILNIGGFGKYEGDLPEINLSRYANNEEFLLLNRGFNSIIAFPYVQNVSETCSPFLDVDFVEFCMALPLKYRVNHRLYYRWVKTKYPDAAKYTWEKLGCSIHSPKVRVMNKLIHIGSVPRIFTRKVLPRLKLVPSPEKTTNHMNPLDYWYNHKPVVHSFFDQYFSGNIDLVDDSKLRKTCINIYQNGNTIDKCKVLTLLSVFKQLEQLKKVSD